jgi:putative hydrolase of the HAD superfamily
MIVLDSVRAYVFDLDDTLYDASMFVRGGTNSVLKWLTVRYDLDLSLLRDDMAGISKVYPRSQWYQKLLAKIGVPCSEELVNEMVHIYRTHPATLRLFPDAHRLLYRLKRKQGFFTGLITDGDVSVQKLKVASLGLNERIHLCIFTWWKGIEYQKPHTWAYEHIEKRLGISGKTCCYFGNNPAKDFLAANKLGWVTVNVCRDGREQFDHLDKEYLAQYTISSFDEIECS